MERVKSIFGDYAAELQVLVDTNLEAFAEPFYPRYFSMGTPQMGLTYATAIGRSRVEAAASVVAHGSEAPLRSRMGLEKLSGEVSAIKVKRTLDEAEYRNWMTIQAMSVSDEAKRNQIIQLIWGDVEYVVNAVNLRIDIMVAQALSSGYVKMNTTSNPDGTIQGNIDLFFDSDKQDHGGTFFGWSADTQRWLSTNTAAQMYVLTDMEYIKQKAEDDYGVVLGTCFMTPATWYIIKKSDELKDAIGADIVSVDAANQLLAANDLPVIQIVNVKGRVEKDGVITSFDAWEDDKYVAFAPAGDLGVLHNSISIEQMAPVQNVDYATANNILVSKWSNTEPFGEYTRGEIAAFPGVEAANDIFIVDTDVKE